MSNWIRVSDELPAIKQDVLLYAIGTCFDWSTYRFMTSGALESEPCGKPDFRSHIGNQFVDATHWMPLPEPPPA